MEFKVIEDNDLTSVGMNSLGLVLKVKGLELMVIGMAWNGFSFAVGT